MLFSVFYSLCLAHRNMATLWVLSSTSQQRQQIYVVGQEPHSSSILNLRVAHSERQLVNALLIIKLLF